MKNDLFIAILKKEKLLLPEKEYRFFPKRRWRADYCWPRKKVIIEIDGGCWIQGRHNRGNGFIADMEKHNQAVLLGYKILRYTPQQLLTNAIDDLKAILP